MSKPGDLLARLGGGDLAILRRIETQRGGFQQMAVILLSTAAVATVSMYFALTAAVFRDEHGGSTLAAPIGWILALAWGFIILNLDRYLTTSMTSLWRNRKLVAMAAVRLLLAFVIGLVISTPLVLQVFKSDINTYLGEVNIAEAAKLKAALQTQLDTELVGANAAVTTAEAELAEARKGDGAASQALTEAKSAVTSHETNLKSLQEAATKAHDIFNCDYYGKPTRAQLKKLYGDYGECSTKAGSNYPATKLKGKWEAAEAAVAAEDKLLDAAKAKVTEIEASLIATAQDNQDQIDQAVAAAEAKLQTVRDNRDSLIAEYDQKKRDAGTLAARNVGLNSQIQGLWGTGGSLRMVHLFVAALFILIELLPVLVKTMKCWGEPSVYDQIVDQIERQVIERLPLEDQYETEIIEHQGATRRAIAFHLDDKDQTVAFNLHDQLQSSQIRANSDIAAAAEQAMRHNLGRWVTKPPAGR